MLIFVFIFQEMTNWTSAIYAAGFFSVFVFIITSVLFIMFLTFLSKTNGKEQFNQQQGNKYKNEMAAAIVLELCAAAFSAIVWGITFGYATVGYKNVCK